ncbi:MAG: CusA/CzcA family heavy metal efflux RND transporter [Bermanella sp.]|nr:CusA/CzcA family heavy metal efflux RND transporter [Bermanella sp.]
MIEWILRFSIERRVLIMMLALVLTVTGIYHYQKLPIDAVPDITNVQVQINTQADGYSPLEVEQRITFNVETAFAGLPKLAYSRSLSRYGLSQVTLVFEEGTDIYFARNLIDQRLSSVNQQLPLGIEATMGPIATGLGEIFMYSIQAHEDAQQENGAPYDITALREIQDWIIKPQLSLVQGIIEVNAIGGYEKQYHVTPWPEKMLSLDVSMADIHQALINSNQNQGAGFIETNGQQLLVRIPGQLKTTQDIDNVIIKTFERSPVFIRDVADVAIGKELRTGAATQNGQETVIATAMMLAGENSREVALNATARLKEIEKSLPQGITLDVVYNRTTLVEKAIATVQKNLIEGALLVIAVLFLLLGNIRAALITAAVIPLAMLGTITGMVRTGVSANLMSLGALDFGLIVDGAVIIVENTTRRLSQAQSQLKSGYLTKKERLNIVFDATNEVIRPSLFGVLIITLVYIPLFSLTGVEGKMFHPMAATVVLALLTALVLSITLVPAMIALFMTGQVKEKENVAMVKSQQGYKKALQWALAFPRLVMTGAITLVLCCVYLATTLGSEFIPQLKEGDIALHAMRTPGTGIEQAVAMQTQLEKEIRLIPEVNTVFSKIGTAEVATDPMPPNVADTFVMLKPKEQWPNPSLTQNQVSEKIEQAIAHLPGNNYEFTQPIQMRFNELISGVRSDLAIKIYGDDLEILLQQAQAVLSQIQTLPGTADARIEQVTGLPMLSIVPDKVALAQYGLNLSQIQSVLAAAISGTQAGLIFEGDRRFDIVLRLPEILRNDINELNNLPIVLDNGEYVPLNEVANIELSPQPNQISREQGKRRIIVSSNIRGVDLGSFVQNAKQTINQNVDIPAGYWLEYAGTFEQLQSASQRLSIVVPLTLLLILGLLVMAFNSIKDALIIFSAIPFALTGGVLALWVTGMSLSISAAVGFIALSGIAVLNGLVMLSFIRQRFFEMGDLARAIMEGAVIRLRPVLMTALVASLGFVPMALNTGTGAEVQRPLATVVIGGIVSSTLLTLFVLPILYSWVHGKAGKKKEVY